MYHGLGIILGKLIGNWKIYWGEDIKVSIFCKTLLLFLFSIFHFNFNNDKHLNFVLLICFLNGMT